MQEIFQNFTDYETFHDGLLICATEIEGIAHLTEPMNSDSDAETDNEIPIKTVAFSNALRCLETVKTYLMQQDVSNAVFNSLYKSGKNSLEPGIKKTVKHLSVNFLRYPIN
ncbi:hypothetical protein TNCV_311721 [Trichonephila clavipes]|nr:hypothetical protein TNCV_311721 [Trichonephila clavipes]